MITWLLPVLAPLVSRQALFGLLGGVAALGMLGGIYGKGRWDGSRACEQRHETARVAAEAKRQAAEQAAREQAAREDAEAEAIERLQDAENARLLDARRVCIDGEWLRDAFTRIR